MPAPSWPGAAFRPALFAAQQVYGVWPVRICRSALISKSTRTMQEHRRREKHGFRGDTVKLIGDVAVQDIQQQQLRQLGNQQRRAARPISHRARQRPATLSQKSTRAMLPLPMPSMLYRPNSFFRRRDQKGVGVKQEDGGEHAHNPDARDSECACIAAPPRISAQHVGYRGK